MKVDNIIISVEGKPRSSFDIAHEFVRKQSCGEWEEKQIDDDATHLSRVLEAYAEAARSNVESQDDDNPPVDVQGLYRRVRRLEEKVLD